MKIGLRIQKLDEMIASPYEVIWDCCCDHGLLGMMLLQRHAAKSIHFVDVIERLATTLQSKLKQHFSGEEFESVWQVHCENVANLSIPDIKSQLIIIAGVGGDTTIELVNSIIANHPNQQMEFLLCPVHRNYHVRECLISHKFGLVNECLIRENGRFYELLHVSSDAKQAISFVGSTMWDFSNEEHQLYLAKMIAHYQRKMKATDINVEKMLLAYQQLQ